MQEMPQGFNRRVNASLEPGVYTKMWEPKGCGDGLHDHDSKNAVSPQ